MLRYYWFGTRWIGYKAYDYQYTDKYFVHIFIFTYFDDDLLHIEMGDGMLVLMIIGV